VVTFVDTLLESGFAALDGYSFDRPRIG